MVLNDESGAWRNSEIATELVRMLEVQACMCDDEIEMPPVKTEMHTDDDGKLLVTVEESGGKKEDGMHPEILKAEYDLNLARIKLAGLASSAGLEGNARAAYLIERALAELD